ncbi:helix-turn-helix domain-containing protein [Marilutibacter spongiae]|uniref:Helix-turn-helix transcriptional regulator n=1 Tax=Marilutibacter spongiae TaxID=2025720 RepID=A0A7W3TLV2_9GAMM|nr:helix-turn-helix transcriptional regulator [Lysobacter spongiae]MBB1060394.1 helix-turn-helix transcriptional regulator [Lysobacter spongiae]
MTEVAIAAAVGARQSTINRIANGHMKPNWELGQALVALAKATEIPPANDGQDLPNAA